MDQPRHAELIVEGETDQHVLSNLLWKHNIKNYRVKRDEIDRPSRRPADELLISIAGSRPELFRMISPKLKASDRSAVGFVVDADTDSKRKSAHRRTWDAIREQVRLAGISSFGHPQSGQPTLFEGRFGMRVGFWIMPDNQQSGAIESFLRGLIDEKDSLIGFAESCTREAQSNHGASFPQNDFLKAQLACWLAWQEEPGRPLGQAILHKPFLHDHKLAAGFKDWITGLLGFVHSDDATSGEKT
jgi:hypothetical protein